MPSISKLPASGPDRVATFVPSASSVTTRSATRIRAAVEVFSASDADVGESDSDVAASFTFVTASEKPAVSGTPPTAVASVTLTVTEYDGFASKSSTTPDFRKRPLPSISKLPASGPDRVATFVPSASSVTTRSATRIRAAVAVFSASDADVGESDSAVGASLASTTLTENVVSKKPPTLAVVRTTTV